MQDGDVYILSPHKFMFEPTFWFKKMHREEHMFQCIILLIYIYINIHIEQYFHSSLINKRKNLPMAFFSTHMYNEGHPIYACVCLGGLH